MQTLDRDDTILVDGKELYPIPEFSNYFCDLDEGRIFSTRTEKWLSTTPNRNGYVYVSLTNDYGENKPLGIHTAIVSAQLGIPSSVWKNSSRNITVDHIDNCKWNNSAENLMLVPFQQQFKNPITKEKLKQRNKTRMTQAEKGTLLAAWESLENPKRNEFVNEWHEKLGFSHRTVDNFVKENLLN
ncbi:HNH endonuclease [Bacillus sp. ISL-46]|uniref:HNH endonuclease n=1 Tax=Bacillus sp. ISL-46 TaxID=2819129 RepID=UPI001BE8635C|nr:HNH endonuclease [Bacillus sp. ISL-46]MBT2723063.1 hypothetical protein [Bacillus sp. ISL-46]